jgi:hypothetical protein
MPSSFGVPVADARNIHPRVARRIKAAARFSLLSGERPVAARRGLFPGFPV